MGFYNDNFLANCGLKIQNQNSRLKFQKGKYEKV